MSKPLNEHIRLLDESFLDCCDVRIASFYRHWKSKSLEGRIPSRKDFDPVEMVPFLSGITMVDVIEAGRDLVYRLVGTNEVNMRGVDPTGKSVKDNYFANSQIGALNNYNHVIHEKNLVYYDCLIKKSNGVFVNDETIFVPLSDDGTVVNIVLLYSLQKDKKTR